MPPTRVPRMTGEPFDRRVLEGARNRSVEGKASVKRKAPKVDDDEETICSICRFELVDKRETTMNCSHRFHKTCLLDWLEKQTCKHNQTCPNCRARFQFLMNGTKKVKVVELFGILQQPTLWFIHRIAHEKEAYDRIPKDHQDHIHDIHDGALARAKVELNSVRSQLRAAESSGKGAEYVDDCREEKEKLEKRVAIYNEMRELAVAAFRKGPTMAGHNKSSAMYYLPAPGRKCAWNLDYEMRRLLGANDAELFPHPEPAVEGLVPAVMLQDLAMHVGSIRSDQLRAAIFEELAEMTSELGNPPISRLPGEHIPLPPPYTMVDLFPDNLNDVPMPAGWREAMRSEQGPSRRLFTGPTRETNERGSQTTSSASTSGTANRINVFPPPAARRRGGWDAAAAAAAAAPIATFPRRSAGRGGNNNAAVATRTRSHHVRSLYTLI